MVDILCFGYKNDLNNVKNPLHTFLNLSCYQKDNDEQNFSLSNDTNSK